MRVNPMIDPLVFHRVAENNWDLSWGLDNFLSYDLTTGTLQAYQALSLGPVRPQKVDNGSVVLELPLVGDVRWLPGVSRKTISDVERG